jgi:hypothetical protein
MNFPRFIVIVFPRYAFPLDESDGHDGDSGHFILHQFSYSLSLTFSAIRQGTPPSPHLPLCFVTHRITMAALKISSSDQPGPPGTTSLHASSETVSSGGRRLQFGLWVGLSQLKSSTSNCVGRDCWSWFGVTAGSVVVGNLDDCVVSGPVCL